MQGCSAIGSRVRGIGSAREKGIRDGPLPGGDGAEERGLSFVAGGIRRSAPLEQPSRGVEVSVGSGDAQGRIALGPQGIQAGSPFEEEGKNRLGAALGREMKG